MDIGVYDVYLALALFGVPERVEANANFLRAARTAQGTQLLSIRGEAA